jgi:hypothetical protein
MRNLYFRLGALLVLATTAACSPSIEEVQKQVRADLEKTYKSTNLKVASLALKKVDDDYEGSLQTNEKGGSFSYTVKVRYKDDRPETTILPTAETAERKLLPILNEQQRDYGLEIRALKINAVKDGKYFGDVENGAIYPDKETKELGLFAGAKYATKFCKIEATAKSKDAFDYKFRFDEKSVRSSVDDYLEYYFTENSALVLVDYDIKKISDRRYEVTFIYNGKFCGAYAPGGAGYDLPECPPPVSGTLDIWLSVDRADSQDVCSMSFDEKFN